MNLIVKIGTAALSRADGAPDAWLLGTLAAKVYGNGQGSGPVTPAASSVS